jgi:CRISPR/Cas system Type II protein with McrA/HNH and RuvC-like nuclease domain
VIEFVRGVKNTAKQRNLQLAINRAREKERRQIESDLETWRVPKSNWKMAVLRVRLCKEQNRVCPFSIDGPNSTRQITERMAAEGNEVEIEHIIPDSITGKTLDFNNVVLCFRKANRNKGQRTPLDWLGPERLAEVLRRIEKSDVRQTPKSIATRS